MNPPPLGRGVRISIARADMRLPGVVCVRDRTPDAVGGGQHCEPALLVAPVKWKGHP